MRKPLTQVNRLRLVALAKAAVPRDRPVIASIEPIILPVIAGQPRDVLEIGSGHGRTLAALDLATARLVAVDIDISSLRRSEQREQVYRVCTNGECLPFPNECFDLVISKVALPYMNIPAALREISRVTRPGGQLFLTLHGFEMAWHRIGHDLKLWRFHDVVFQFYAMLNGVTLRWLDAQFRWPLNRRTCESVHTVGAITRALGRAGFDNIVIQRRGRIFAAGARRRELDSRHKARGSARTAPE